ncbi:fibronectin type III domain-containing protein [Candidatus Vecturithrix granuli]|uniref:Fibronectin type III domain-containing protein n=1 Tax=Vecturithrix granuli TaxID=1499967 RepID=A0A081C2L8_VECG1|nr:fibronectin type III domain-containing protein [Candidatus Vecturithrix granuli]
MKKKTVLFLFISIFIMPFCHSRVSAQLSNISPDREYVIGIGDLLDILVWRVPELSSQVFVRSDGKISMPFLGDIRAVGLKISSLEKLLAGKEEGKEIIAKYVKEPKITISLLKSSEKIQITISGVLSQMAEVPRQTKIKQMLEQLIPQIPLQPPPNLRAIKVISTEGEEFPISWPELQSGNAPHMNIRLEWGDEIHIPSEEIPTPTPVPVSTPALPSVAYTKEELQELLQEHPDTLETLLSAATQLEDERYSFDITKMTEEQQNAIGEEVLQMVFGDTYTVPQRFTNITLSGINVNLAVNEAVEAYLAFPHPDPQEPPLIQRFREGELVEKGESEEEDIYLEKIQDRKKQVLLRKGKSLQILSLSPSFSNAKLSGIVNIGETKKAFFSDLNLSKSKRVTTRRGFQENDEIEKGILLVKIAEDDKWALLKKEQEFQLVLLRDSLNRVSPSEQVPKKPEGATPGTEDEDSSGAPIIDVWYGPHQVFGHIGIPQRWVNILGNVTDKDGVASLTYSLNGGGEQELKIGGPYKRLVNKGDFNIDLAYADLLQGINQVIITAMDTLGNQSRKTIEVEYVSGNTWILPYTIDWNQVENIQEVAQIVDGYWVLEGDSVRSVAPGYDRLIAIGDVSWKDYEVMVTITAHNVNSSGEGFPPGIGILMRWDGHHEWSNERPYDGWYPMGALGWYRDGQLRITGGGTNLDLGSPNNFEFTFETPYTFKMRVETTPTGARYSLKVWPASLPEPLEWNLIGEEGTEDPQNGSFLFVSHHYDASFGRVSVIPLNQ